VPGARMGMEGVWTFAQHWSAVLSLGALVQDGATRITFEDRRVASVPAFSGLLALGIEYGR